MPRKENQTGLKDLFRALSHLGEYWTGDWSDFDGRLLSDQLDEIYDVAIGNKSASDFINSNPIER